MKCISEPEYQRWLTVAGIAMTPDRDLHPADQGDGRFSIQLSFPKDASMLFEFARCVINWLPSGGQRILWLKYWHTYPPDPVIAFENVRRGFGEKRPIIEAPAHVFEFPPSKNYESREYPDIAEEAVMSSLALLIMCFDWSAYIVTKNSSSCIYIDDERVVLS